MSFEQMQQTIASAHAILVAGNGGLPVIRISKDGMLAEVYLHGAQVTSWKPAGSEEVLFTSAQSNWSEDKAIRAGVPICFPWFGPKAEDASAPQHGFARNRNWSLDHIVEEGGNIVVEVSDSSDAATKALWPFEFSLRNRLTFGTTLKMELEVTNRGTLPFSFEEAQHTYLRVGDVQQVVVEGLDDYQYSDKTQGGARVRQRGDITFRGEIDRPYFDTRENIGVLDPSLSRKITVAKTNSDATVIWNPWIEKARNMKDLGDDEWQRFVCVETCNLGTTAITLAPGESHRMGTEISVSSI